MKYFYLIILKVICKLQIVVQKNCEYEQKYVYEGLYFLETVFAICTSGQRSRLWWLPW